MIFMGNANARFMVAATKMRPNPAANSGPKCINFSNRAKSPFGSTPVACQGRTLYPTRYLRNVPSPEIRCEEGVEPGAAERNVRAIR